MRTDVTTKEELKAFLLESLIMKNFSHSNILGLVGICFDAPNGYPFLVFLFMANGSLKDYLMINRVHVTDIDTYPKVCILIIKPLCIPVLANYPLHVLLAMIITARAH